MNNKIKFKPIEVLLLASILVALLFKEFHLPGASLSIILSAGILSMLYCYFGIILFTGIKLKTIFKKESYSPFSTGKIIGSILVGLLLSILLIVVLFKLMSWPGAIIMLLMPLGLLGIPLLLVLVKYVKTKSVFYRNMLIRVLVIGGFGLFLFLLPPFAILEHYYKDNPEYLEAEKELAKDPENRELQEKAQELFLK